MSTNSGALLGPDPASTRLWDRLRVAGSIPAALTKPL